jgi:hypothetical protein
MTVDPEIFHQPTSSDVRCDVRAQDLVINVSCVCQLAGMTGYQVIFQFKDPENVESIIALFARSGSCSNSVLWTVERSGNYCITVFPVRGKSGIADSQVSHAEELLVGDSKSPVLMSSSINVNLQSTSSPPGYTSHVTTGQKYTSNRGKINQCMS